MDDPRDFLEYETRTGLFRWIKPRSNRLRIGDVAGTITNGYIMINVCGQRIYAHRLAMFFMGVEIPRGYVVNHINENKLDNRWKNLEVVSPSFNLLKQGIRRHNKSGATGVFYMPQNKQNPWWAYIDFAKERISLGYFQTRELAMAARKHAYKNLITTE